MVQQVSGVKESVREILETYVGLARAEKTDTPILVAIVREKMGPEVEELFHFSDSEIAKVIMEILCGVIA